MPPSKPRSTLACSELARRDPMMARFIRAFGELKLCPSRGATTFGSLSRMIIGQQLSSKAARTIFSRYQALIPSQDVHDFQCVATLEFDALRRAGLSRAKARFIKELAQGALERRLPELKMLRRLDEESIADVLLEFNGIGTWTLEMFQIFVLGKPDVLSFHDAGLRRAFELAYQRPAHKPGGLAAYQKIWSPFCSTASLYLWKVADNPERLQNSSR